MRSNLYCFKRDDKEKKSFFVRATAENYEQYAHTVRRMSVKINVYDLRFQPYLLRVWLEEWSAITVRNSLLFDSIPKNLQKYETDQKTRKKLKSGRKSKKTTSATLSTERGDLYGKKCERSFVHRIIKTLPDEFVKRWLIIKEMMTRIRFVKVFFQVRIKGIQF